MRTIDYLKHSLSVHSRAKRVALFSELCQKASLKNLRLLDIGGTKAYWEQNLKHIPLGLIQSIDIVNIGSMPVTETIVQGVTLIEYSGNALDRSSFRLEKYDLVYSNSVIEHVGSLLNQREMAGNILALSSRYFVQTPSKCFPLEPHFLIPFFPYYPLTLRAFFLRHLECGGYGKKRDWVSSRIAGEYVRPLIKKEFQQLFPGGTLHIERYLFIPKSYMITNIL